MHLPKSVILLLAALVLALMGVAAYLLYQVNVLKTAVVGVEQAGQLPTPTTITLYGTAKSIGSNSLVITTDNGDAAVDLSNTTSLVASTPKTSQAYNDEIKQYDAELSQLRAQNDQAGINALVFPLDYTTQTIALSDIKTGDVMVITCVGQQSGNTCEAQQVLKSQLPATSTSP
jgi:hypothetical protein